MWYTDVIIIQVVHFKFFSKIAFIVQILYVTKFNDDLENIDLQAKVNNFATRMPILSFVNTKYWKIKVYKESYFNLKLHVTHLIFHLVILNFTKKV